MWLLRLKNTQWMLIKNVFHPNLPNMCDNPPELWLFGYKECAPPVFTQCAITWMLIVGVDLTHSDPQHNTHRFVGTQDLKGESKKRGWLWDSTMSGLINSVPWPTEMSHPILKTSNTGEYHTIWLLKKQNSSGLTYLCVKASPFYLTHPLYVPRKVLEVWQMDYCGDKKVFNDR